MAGYFRGVVRGANQGMGQLAMALTGGARAEQAGVDQDLGLQSKLAQALASIRQSDASADKTDAETAFMQNRPMLNRQIMAANAGTDVPTVDAFMQRLNTGQAPQVPMGPEAPDGGMGVGSQQFPPELASKLGLALQRFAPTLIGSGAAIGAGDWAGAQEKYREQDLSNDVLGGARQPGDVGRAQAAAAGKPLFATDNLGQITDIFGGQSRGTGTPAAQGKIDQVAAQTETEAVRRDGLRAQAERDRAAAARDRADGGGASKLQPGYRWKADGSGEQEFIPGGPADPKTKREGKSTGISPTLQKALLEADDASTASGNVTGALQKALALNDTAYSGVGAKTRAVVRANVPGMAADPAADATIAMENLIVGQALTGLKAAFGSNPTEGERKILLDIQASVDKTPAQRAEIINRAIALAKRRGEMSSGRAKAIRSGTYLSDDPSMEPAAPAPGATGKTVKRTGTANGRKVIEYTDGSVEYAPKIDPASIKWDTAPDPAAVKWDAAPADAAPAVAPMAQAQEQPSFLRRFLGDAADTAGGLVRGAGSIGATIAWPIDKAHDLIAGDRGPTMAGMVAGQQPLSRNEERRRDMTEGLRSLGANPDSLAFKAGSLTSEIGGTAGAGGAIANALASIPGVAAAAPMLLEAIGSAGMTTGAAPVGAVAKAADLGRRTLGGAVAGGAQAGMVSPADAAGGATVGAALPGALKVAGTIGQGVGRVLRGPEQAPAVREAAQAAKELGLAVSPTQARGTLANRLLEGTAGKLTTAQNASARNAPKVNAVIARDLGLPEGVPLDRESLGYVKKAAGVLYDAVASAGTVQPGPAYAKALDAIAQPHVLAARGFPKASPSPVIEMVRSLRAREFDAGSAVSKIKELRSAADDAFKPCGAGADIGRASRAAADALDDALGVHLQKIGEPELLGQWHSARALYAKASNVEKAMDASGNIDARKLAQQIKAKVPLSGDTKKVALVADSFRPSFQSPGQMGGLPQISPLDWAFISGGGLGAAASGDPRAWLAAGIPALRVGARSAALSPLVQNRLVQPAATQMDPALAQAFYRAAPLIASGDR